MKATGIVRRIDDYVIIGARSESLENTGVSLILSNFCASENHWQEDLRRAVAVHRREDGSNRSKGSLAPATDAHCRLRGLFYFSVPRNSVL